MELSEAMQEKVAQLVVAINAYFTVANAIGCDPATAQRILEEEQVKAQKTAHLDGVDAVAIAQVRLLSHK